MNEVSEREVLGLLDRAARAVGAKPYLERDWPGICLSDDPDCKPFWVNVIGSAAGTWDPLNDDGDAFRLAVALMLEVTVGPTHCKVVRRTFSAEREHVHCVKVALNDKPLAATRRAIVFAATSTVEGGAQ